MRAQRLKDEDSSRVKTTFHKSTKLVPKLKNTSKFITLIFLICSIALPQCTVQGMPTMGDGIAVSPEQLDNGIAVQLQGFQIFGDGQFTTAYINKVGAVSFVSPLSTSDLSSVQNRMLLFAPALLLPNNDGTGEEPDISITYRTTLTEQEKSALEGEFRSQTSDLSLTVTNVFIVTVEDNDPDGNSFEITFVGNNDKTYLRYKYNQLNRIQDRNGYAKGGLFAFDDGAILCAEKIPHFGSQDLSQNLDRYSGSSLYWNIDLPLECQTFESDCKDLPDDVESTIKADFQGVFLRTHTESAWSTYALYYCMSGREKGDGTINVRQGCVYDPDYYTHSWMELSAIDQCSSIGEPTPPALG